MRTSLQRILTEDNLELVGLLYEPNITTNKILVHVHGMAGNFYENKFLDSIAKTLTDNGFAFFAFNNRGCELVKDLIEVNDGKRNIKRIGNAYEIFEDSAVDIKSAINFVEGRDFSEIHLSGHSLGAPKVAYYVAESGDKRIKSVLFLSPSDMVGLIASSKNRERDLITARKMVTEGNGQELLPFSVLWDEGPLSANTYISLSCKDSKVAIFNFHNPEDQLGALSRISIPLFSIMGQKDDALVVSIDETMDRIKKAATSSPRVQTNILGEATHGYDGYEQQLADAILSWLGS